MDRCSVEHCFQPATYSAFYDLLACEEHLTVASRFAQRFGRQPSEEELTQPLGRLLRALPREPRQRRHARSAGVA